MSDPSDRALPIARIARATAWIIDAALVVVAGAINYTACQEAYGSGPPYYSRTVNMDKWSSPFPLLAVVDSVVIILIIASVYIARRFSANTNARA